MKIAMLVTMLAGVLSAHAQHPEWIARYDGRMGSADAARSIAVDDLGNVYVTGYSWEAGGFHDYLTIKYSPSGDTLWVARYDGTGNEIDQAYALAVDDSGNVYVTGLSEDEFDSFDCATIKYNSSGDSVWVARYDGPDGLEDEAYAIAADDSGNVYVTGYSRSSAGYRDYLTIKYNASGDTVWVARYDGPSGMTDIARDIAVDGEGNVYVTGYSQDVGDLDDYLTIKYGPDGDTLWVARYDGPGYYDRAQAIAIDDFANVYVTGYSEDSLRADDYATIKYSPSGDSLWIARYDGPGSYDDKARAMAVDDSGNVYVTGHSMGVGFSYDYLTIKYSTAGDTLWTSRYDGPSSENDTASAIAVDDSGNVYVTGVSHAHDPEWDYLTIKYSPSGDSLWTARYDGPVESNDYAYGIAVDDLGYVYVTGSSVGSGTLNDFLTIKYSSATGVQEYPGSSARACERLKAYPNPFNQQAVIHYSCPSQSHISLNLYDMAGRFVARIHEGEVAGGHHAFRVRGDDFSQGVYFVHLSTDGSNLAKKVILLK